MTASIPSPPFRTALLGTFISIHMRWLRYLNTHVPDPYLDEVFHIPQAQAYWAGRWNHWDDKITTPPGLYLWSYAFNTMRRLVKGSPVEMVSVEELRFSNAVLLYVLWITVTVWTTVARRSAGSTAGVALLKESVMMGFPLLAFFSGLYYTDLFSAWTVVATFVVWESGRGSRGFTKLMFQVLHVLLGLLSLASRQTNIFWVAVFLGGLQVVETVQAGTTTNVVNDPQVGEAHVEDLFQFVLQLIPAAVTNLPTLILDLWPQLALLVSFATFVVWNGGVVLGDKSNHIATIHLPQMLYIWPCILFFSWPVLLPHLTKPQRLLRQFPRPWLAVLIILAMSAVVHYNTIVHPFTLADNRHYVFYVFRILTRQWWVKYAAVPVYFTCACLVMSALSGGGPDPSGDDNTVRLSFLTVWFASTALSLISAPLVEPRYFIIPWIVWRLYVPGNIGTETPDSDARDEKETDTVPAVGRDGVVQKALQMLADYSLWVELAWYLTINYGTCWMFLSRGFEWRQEAGKVQRFMW